MFLIKIEIFILEYRFLATVTLISLKEKKLALGLNPSLLFSPLNLVLVITVTFWLISLYVASKRKFKMILSVLEFQYYIYNEVN